MKKCTRCSNVIDWDKPFCPLCGGSVTDVQGPPKFEPGIPAIVEKISSAPRDFAPVPPPPANIPPAGTPPRPAQTEVPPVAPAPPIPPMRAPVPPVQAQIPPPPPPLPAPAKPAPAASGEARVPSAPQAGLFSQIHQTPSVPAPQPPAPPLAEVISQIHQAADVPPPLSPQPGGFFSQIHQPEAASPKPVPPPIPNVNTGLYNGQTADRPQPPVTFQELTDKVDGSESSLGDALDMLLKSGPPLDFAPPSPAAPPPSFMPPPAEKEPPLLFTGERYDDDSEKDVLSPNLAEIMGINSIADLTGNAREAAPKTVPQAPAKPQIPPPPAQVIPDLPDDQPKGSASGDDSDFLKMFPGVGG